MTEGTVREMTGEVVQSVGAGGGEIPAASAGMTEKRAWV